jgi:hypothetical protein
MDSKSLDKVIQKVHDYMEDFTLDSEEFGKIALELYDIHRQFNPVYKKYDIGPLDDWRRIPFMPISEFKNSEVGLVMSDRMPFPGVEFHSSGTTQKDKSKHRMYDTETYRKSIITGYHDVIDDDASPNRRVVILSPTLSHSSLFYMMSYYADQYDYRGVREQFYNFGDRTELESWLESLKNEDHPVVLFGTSLALYDLSEVIRNLEEVPLPEGSMIIETGGWKGRDIRITPQQLTSRVNTFFGIPYYNCVREYSMSEMSSQLYHWNTSNSHDEKVLYRAPHWLLVRTVDPLTQREVKEGEEGIIAFVDLANVWSCPFILTEDIGILYNGSPFTQLVLRGRAENAPEKGCSLTYAQATALDN